MINTYQVRMIGNYLYDIFILPLRYVIMLPPFWAFAIIAIRENSAALYYELAAVSFCFASYGRYVMWDFSLRNFRLAREKFFYFQDYYSIKPVLFLNYLNPEVADIIPTSLKSIYILQMTPRGGVAPLDAYLAFPQVNIDGVGDTIIFIDKAPHEIGRFDRFFILHEIGHAAFSGLQHILNKEKRSHRIMLMFSPCFLFQNSILLTIFVIICAAAYISLESNAISSEVSADQFACNVLVRSSSFTDATALLRKMQSEFFSGHASKSEREYRDRSHAITEFIFLYSKFLDKKEKGNYLGVIDGLFRPWRIFLNADLHETDFLAYRKISLSFIPVIFATSAMYLNYVYDPAAFVSVATSNFLIGYIIIMIGWIISYKAWKLKDRFILERGIFDKKAIEIFGLLRQGINSRD